MHSRTLLLSFLSVALGGLLALILGEIVIRVVGIGYGNAPLVSDPVLHHVHPQNYRFVSHHPNGEYGGHEVYYDARGLVANPTADGAPANARYRVAFLGDSFTEAVQVAYNDSFAGVTEKLLRGIAEVRNYGVSSYSPILYLLQWRHRIREFRPTHVIVLLYGNDISDDRVRAQAAVYDDTGRLVALPGAGNDGFRSLLRKSYLMRFLRKVQLQVQWMLEHGGEQANAVGGLIEENPPISDLSSGYMAALLDEVRASGAELILMVVPSKYRQMNPGETHQQPEFSDRWKQWARQRSVRFVDLVAAFGQEAGQDEPLFFEQDIHFNEKGHARVAAALKRELSGLESGNTPD